MRLTLKTVLIGSIGLLALAAVGQGAASISKITSVEQSSSAVTKNWLPSVSIINEINTSTRDVRVKLYRFVVASNTVEGFSKNEAALIELITTSRR